MEAPYPAELGQELRELIRILFATSRRSQEGFIALWDSIARESGPKELAAMAGVLAFAPRNKEQD